MNKVCPYCQSELLETQTVCPSCHAKKLSYEELRTFYSIQNVRGNIKRVWNKNCPYSLVERRTGWKQVG